MTDLQQPPSIRAHENRVLAWLNAAIVAWPHGGRNQGQFRVLLGIAERSIASGLGSFNVSLRRLAEVSGVDVASSPHATGGQRTCRRAVRELAAWGMISVTTDEVDPFMASTRITLAQPDGMTALVSCDDPTTCIQRSCACLLAVSGITELHNWLSPVFERAGIGVLACRVWHLLRHGEALSAAEIGDRLGVSRQSVHAQLKTLEQQAMAVQRSSSSLWQAVERNLDEVAQVLGVADRPANRQAINHRERNNYRNARRVRESGGRAPLQDSSNDRGLPRPATSRPVTFIGEGVADGLQSASLAS